MSLDGAKDKEIDELRKTVENLQQVKENLRRSEEMYKFLAENSVDAIWQLDNQLRFVYMSPVIKDTLGYQAEEIIGQHLFSILTPESVEKVKQGYASRKDLQASGQRWGSSTYTVEAVHRDGHRIWTEVSVNPIFGADNQLIGYNGITRDISERRRTEESLRQHAFSDPLTSLPNRWSFEEVLGSIITQHRNLNQPFAVMFLDVDGLKKVNDAYGHATGDELLKMVADRLGHMLRKQDFIARLAGDEFMAILPGVGDNSAAQPIVTRLLESFRQTMVIGANNIKIGVSIGICFFPADADNVEALMHYADQAMYKAKKNGGGSCACHGQDK